MIGVENFFHITFFGHANSVSFPHNGSKVDHYIDIILSLISFTDEANDTILIIPNVNPLKTGRVKRFFVQSRF